MVSASLAIGDDVEDRLAWAKPQLALYIGGMGARGKNFYHNLATRYGFGEVADHIQDLYLAGKKEEAIAAVPDDLVRNVSLVGPRRFRQGAVGRLRRGRRHHHAGAPALRRRPRVREVLRGARRARALSYTSRVPPSTVSTVPVLKALLHAVEVGHARRRPPRRRGRAESVAPLGRTAWPDRCPDIASHSGVRITPGATALTRMGASSTASAVVRAFIAPHRLTGSAPNPGCQAAVPLVSVIEPPSRRRGPKTRTALSAPMNRVCRNAVDDLRRQVGQCASSSDSPAVYTR